MNAATIHGSVARTGFRELKVVAKVRESAIITSFYLEPANPQDWRAFDPGQFLVIRIPVVPAVAGERDYVLRNYSVSSSSAGKSGYRISVKREAAAAPGLPDGIGSCFLHDRIEVGDVIEAEGPRGDFVLDSVSKRPVVLLSGGVGLTPMVSMLHALAATDRWAIFIHACENGDVHALQDEVTDLVVKRPGLAAHYLYRTPSERDKVDRRFHSEGMISRDLLQRLLPLNDYDFYLCGPPPFMQAIYAMLRDLGVGKQRIAYEFFGPATVLEPDAPGISQTGTLSVEKKTADDETTVEFRKSGIKACWNSEAPSLLDFAEDKGLTPEFSCRAGICGSCKSTLISGDVSYFQEPLDELEAGEVLLCCSKPLGPVVLDI